MQFQEQILGNKDFTAEQVKELLQELWDFDVRANHGLCATGYKNPRNA